MENNLLNQIILNNTISAYIISLFIIFAGIIFIRIFEYLFFEKIHRVINKVSTSFGDFFNKALDKRIVPLTYLIIIFGAINRLTLSSSIDRILNILFIIAIVIYITLLLQDIVIYTLKKYWEKKQSNQAQDTVFAVTVFIIKLVIWLIALLFVLDNLNIEIRGLITGLGVGGIAIAFAAQTILADIFSYFTIFLDRPFNIGDFIIVGDNKGTVEHIGIKTTRIRSLSGEQLVFSNNDLTNSRINNYKRMQHRRINFSFGVVYGTELEQLEKIPQYIEDIINSIDKTTFDRAHFASYGDYSLIFQVVYYVEDSDYKVYMDIQESINLKMKEKFKEEGIEFAFPTQSVHVYDQKHSQEIQPVQKIKEENNNE